MHRLTQLTLAVAFSIIGGTVHAEVETNSFLIEPALNLVGNIPGGYNFLYNLSNELFSQATARVAGDTFVDYFIFAVADDLDVSFTTSSSLLPRSGTQEISFSTFEISTYTPTYTEGLVYDDEVAAGTSMSFSSSTVSLNSGLYVLTETGTIDTDGGAYSGQLYMTPTVAAVPEPTSIAMLLAGMGAISAVRRRSTKI